jgi:imidazolonepropionase-like amidohydrolase
MILLILLFGLAWAASAQDSYIIQNAKIYTVSGPVIERGDVVIQQGIIAAVGPGLAVPAGAQRIDGRGLSVYPGLFDAHTILGMTEPTREMEMGALAPELLIFSSFRTSSARIPVARVNGVTHILSRPRITGIIPGQGAIMNLAGWTPEQMEIRRRGALILDYPSLGSLEFSADERYEIPSFSVARAQYEKRVGELKKLLAAARQYMKAPSAVPDLRLEALVPALRGELPVLITAGTRVDIRNAVEFARQENLNYILVGAVEAWKVVDFLKQNNVRVILGPSQTMPLGEDDPADAVYRTAALLHARGVPFAIATVGASGATYAETHYLPYQAGLAVAYGLPYEAGLRSITLTPAEFLGIADKVGSIEKGKKANLAVADGDILECTTRIKHLFINGKPAPLETVFAREYEKYAHRP